MAKRREIDFSMQASLHGMDIKTSSSSEVESVDLTQEQKDMMDMASKQALERKNRRGGQQ